MHSNALTKKGRVLSAIREGLAFLQHNAAPRKTIRIFDCCVGIIYTSSSTQVTLHKKHGGYGEGQVHYGVFRDFLALAFPAPFSL